MSNLQRWTDQWNQGSFVSPVPAPNAEPGAAPTVCVQFSAVWLPYVLGALFQLVQPSAYQAASAGYADAVGQAQGLMAIFSEGGVCTDMLQFQFTDTCGLQYSLDGGVTWIEVPGWDTFAPSCFTGPVGATGATGAAGGFTPGVPPIQPGQSTSDLACSVAGYIAQTIIRAGMQHEIDGIDAAHTVIDIATALITFWIGGPVVAVVATNAVNALYGLILGGTESDYTDALADDLLWSDVTCAIYTATQGDGYVTDANFAAVQAAIAAIVYVHSDVITAISEYIDQLGASGLAGLQIPGALQISDCSGCADNANALLFVRGTDTIVTLDDDIVVGGSWSFGGWFTGMGSFLTETIVIGGYNGTAVTQWDIYATSAGQYLQGYLQSLTDDVVVGGPPAIDAGNHHFCFVVDGGTTNIYLDGVLVGTAATPLGPFNAVGGATTFGGYPAAPAQLGASVWGWANYTRALSGTDVADWAGSGTFGAPPAGAANIWLFGEGTGGTVHDSVAANNGSIFGTPTWTTHS